MNPQAQPPTGPGRKLTAYVGALVVVDMAFATALTPLLPHYTHLAAQPKAVAGILMGAYPLGSLIGALPGGLMTGRFGSRTTVVTGVGIVGGAGLLFGWSTAVAALAAARFIQGAAGSCTWAGGLAWLAGATPAARRGKALGTAMGFAAAGALAGPAVGAFASWAGTGPAFSLTAAVSATLIIGAFLLPRPQDLGARILLPGRRVLCDRGISAGLFLTALGGVALGALDVLAPLRLSQLGVTALVIAGTYLAAGAGEAALSPWVGRLSDRHGEAAPTRVLLAAGAIVSLAFPLLGRPGWLVALLVIGMPVFGSLCTPGSILVSAGAERLRLHQGAAFGLGNLAWSGGQAAAAVATGAIAQAISDLVPAALLGGLCLVTLAVLRSRSRLTAPPLVAAERGRP